MSTPMLTQKIAYRLDATDTSIIVYTGLYIYTDQSLKCYGLKLEV